MVLVSNVFRVGTPLALLFTPINPQPLEKPIMSLSEMSRDTYRKHFQSIRANGERSAIAWIQCPLERADMRELCNQQCDHLREREAMHRYETPRIALLLTTQHDVSNFRN